MSRGGDGTRGGWDSRGVGASRTSAGGRRHEAARRREAGRRGGVRRWGERVRVHATHRGWTVVRDASVRRRARDVPGVRVNPGGNTTGAAHERTKDPPPSVVDATTNEIHVTVHRPASKVITQTRTVVVRARARGAVRDARVGTRARGRALRHRTERDRVGIARACAVRRRVDRRGGCSPLRGRMRPRETRRRDARRRDARRFETRPLPPPSSSLAHRA